MMLYTIFNVFQAIKAFYQLLQISKTQLNKGDYQAIVISGVLVLSTVKFFKKHYPNVKIIADIHGAFEEFIEFKQKSLIQTVVYQIAYKLIMLEQKRSLPYCDGAFVVSDALKNYLNIHFDTSNLIFFKVPCSTSRKVVYDKKAAKTRHKWRKEFGIVENELLFIYSGGTSVWQSIGDAYDLFRMLRNKMSEQKMHFLIMSFDIKNLQYLASEDTTIRAFNPDVVQDVLFAGDYAFLLRGNYITNNVAFPNKFIEYVISGMHIISTPYVFDVEYYIRTNSLGIILESNKDKESDLIAGYIQTHPIAATNWASRQKLIDDLCFENTLKSFNTYIA